MTAQARTQRAILIGCLAAFTALAVVVMTFAFYAAFDHTYTVVKAAGQVGVVAWMSALLPDLLALLATAWVAVALYLGLRPWPCWSVLVVAVTMTIAGQVGAVVGRDWRAYTVAVAPAAVFLIALGLAHLLVRALEQLVEVLRAPARTPRTPSRRTGPPPRTPRSPSSPSTQGARNAQLVLAQLTGEAQTIAQLARASQLGKDTVRRALRSAHLADCAVQVDGKWMRTPVRAAG